MARVTSKLQVTVPKSVADQFSIKPGDEIDWIPAGDGIRVVKRKGPQRKDPAATAARLRLFDQATDRQRRRNQQAAELPTPTEGRGWTREDLYRRGGSD